MRYKDEEARRRAVKHAEENMGYNDADDLVAPTGGGVTLNLRPVYEVWNESAMVGTVYRESRTSTPFRILATAANHQHEIKECDSLDAALQYLLEKAGHKAPTPA